METGIENIIDRDNSKEKGIWIGNNAPDDNLEQDNPEALKQRYDAIYDLWKFRHDFALIEPRPPLWQRLNPWQKRETEEEKEARRRKSVHDYLDMMVKAYSTNKTSFDFNNILGGLDVQNVNASSDHLSDIAYMRFTEYQKLDKDKVKITLEEGSLEFNDGRRSYLVSPTKVEMKPARETDPPISLTWAEAFRMADDALENDKNLPPNTMYLRGTKHNVAMLEAALHIRTQHWAADRKPTIDGGTGKFNAKKAYKNSDPYGVLDEARDFVERARKNGTPLYPPGLGDHFSPLREMIGNNWEERQAIGAATSPASEPALSFEPADAHMQDYAAFKENMKEIVTEPSVEESEARMGQAIDDLNQAADEIDAAKTSQATDSITHLANVVASSQQHLLDNREELGPYESYGMTAGMEEVFKFSKPFTSNPDLMKDIFFTDDGNDIKILKIVAGNEVVFDENDPDMAFKSHDEIVNESIESSIEFNKQRHALENGNSQKQDGASLDIDGMVWDERYAAQPVAAEPQAQVTEAAALRTGVKAPIVWYTPSVVQPVLEEPPVEEKFAEKTVELDQDVVAAAKAIIGEAEVAAASNATAIPDWYNRVREMMTTFPKEFQGIKTDKLEETVNLAIQRVNPDATLLPAGSNDRLLELLQDDHLIQIKDLKSGKKITKVAAFNNYDPVYKDIVKEVVGNRELLVGRSYADFEAMVKELRRSDDADDMGKFSADIAWKVWKHLRTDGVIAVNDASKHARILDVADGLKKNIRYNLTSEFSKAANYLRTTPPVVNDNLETEKPKETTSRKRTPLAEEMDQAAGLPALYRPQLPFAPSHYAMGDFPSAAIK